MNSPLRFPTALHEEVAELARNFFSAHPSVDTILVVNSCARGRAVAGSDLDMAVLIISRVAFSTLNRYACVGAFTPRVSPKAHSEEPFGWHQMNLMATTRALPRRFGTVILDSK